ncbi:MAG TPA: hypothetical protein VKV27_10125 [Solirubrobacteraceae bacterium]|nr:hypothetical protein [Solirubrobacteraceae bacterium]
MSAAVPAGLVLALASTSLVNLAYVREQSAVRRLPALSLRRPLALLRLLAGSRPWLVAFAMEGAGFGLYVAALALAPLALVQSVAAGGLAILALASARVARRRLRRRELAGSVIGVAGLALLAVSLSGGSAPDGRGSTAAIVLWLGATAIAAALVLIASRATLRRGVADGVAGGLMFSVGDICTKLATEGGARVAFAVGLIGGYVAGSSLLQVGYQREAALTVAGIGTLLTNLVPIAAGTLLLGERVPSGTLGILRVVAFATVIAGAVLLARPQRRAASRPSAGQPGEEPLLDVG